MPFNEEIMRFPKVSLFALLFLALVAQSIAYETGLQFEATGRFALQQSTAPLAPETFYGGGTNATVQVARRVSSILSLYLKEQHAFVGSEVDRWLVAPNYAALQAGCELAGPGIIGINAAVTQYPFAKQYSPSFMPPSEALSPEWLNRASMHWTVGEESPVYFDGDLSFFNYRYNHIQKNTSLAASEVIANRYGPQNDNDFWSTFLLRGNLPEDLYLQVTTRFKLDMEPSSVYDLHNHGLSFGGRHGDRKSSVLIDWYVRERFVKSAAMFYNGYHDGFSTEAGIRPVLKFRTGVYLKGNAQVTISDRLYRQYLELAFRRWWKSGSAIDLTWWNSWGGLFPRQCGEFSTSFYAAEQFGFSPSIALYFGDIPARGIYRFYRADGKGELFFHFDERTVLKLGGTYAYFDHHPYFGSGWKFYAGVRRW